MRYNVQRCDLPGTAPRFLNTETTVTIMSDESVGNTIFTLQYTDDDPTDVATLTLFMEYNAFFNLDGAGKLRLFC